MPVVEQSGLRLEYPIGDEQPRNGMLTLRARVSPPHVNNRVWFAYQVDDGRWQRSQASRESAITNEEQYFLAVDVSSGQVGLKYLAYVRRAGTTLPRGADTRSPDEDPTLKELIVYVSLSHDNGIHRDTRPVKERSEDFEGGLANETTNVEARLVASRDEEQPVSTPRIEPRRSSPKLKLKSDMVSHSNELLPEVPADELMNTPQTLLNSIINDSFENDKTIRAAITDNLKESSTKSIAFTHRAQEVFSNFNPSRVPFDEHRKNYLKRDDDLRDRQKDIIIKGIESRRKSDLKPSLRLANIDELRKFLRETRTDNGSNVQVIDLDKLMSHITLKAPSWHFKAKQSVMTECKAEIEAERRLKAILDSTNTAHEASSNDSSANEISSNAVEATGLDASALTANPTKLVNEFVNLQMGTSTSPESQLRYSVPDHSNQMNNIHNNIQTFELRSGPADVTSYHDFHNLQIAFENIWTEKFDGQLASLGQQLYAEYVKLKDFSGVDDGIDPITSTIEDLKQLMSEARSLADQTVQNLSPAVHSSQGTSNTNNTGTGSSFEGAVAGGIKGAAAATFLPGVDPITATIAGTFAGWLGWI
jgi:hypothetical protein